MLQVIIGAGVILAAVLLREVIARVGHQRAILRRGVNELTNLFPLWLSRFHPEFEQLHGQFPPPLEFISPPFQEEQQIRTLIMEIQTNARWPLVKGIRQVQKEVSRALSILMAVRTRAAGGAYLTTEEYTSISLKIHALGDLVIGEQYRHDDLATTMALGQGRSGNDLPKHSGDDLTKHYVNRGFIKHPPL